MTALVLLNKEKLYLLAYESYLHNENMLFVETKIREWET